MTATRLNLQPENQLADLLDEALRDSENMKLTQTAASNGLVFYESQSGDTYDFDDNVATVGGGQSAPGIPMTITAEAEDDVLLLGDLIIETALLDGVAVTQMFYDNVSPSQKSVNRWRVFLVAPSTGTKHVQLKCRVVANTSITIVVEYTP